MRRNYGRDDKKCTLGDEHCRNPQGCEGAMRDEEAAQTRSLGGILRF